MTRMRGHISRGRGCPLRHGYGNCELSGEAGMRERVDEKREADREIRESLYDEAVRLSPAGMAAAHVAAELDRVAPRVKVEYELDRWDGPTSWFGTINDSPIYAELASDPFEEPRRFSYWSLYLHPGERLAATLSREPDGEFWSSKVRGDAL